jgi:hypothetical protein
MPQLIWTILLMTLSLTCKSQSEGLKFYLQGGVNYNTGTLGVDSALSSASQIIEDINSFSGWHAGLTIREYRSSTQYLSFESLYAYNKTKLTIGAADSLSLPTYQTLTSQTLQLAISPGFRIFKILRAQAGLNGVFQLNNTFKESFDTFKLGYRLGVGLDIFKLTADLAYNASFDPTLGIFEGVPLSNANSQFLLTLGYKF